ncbi:MAG TPA: hypothetical protein PLL28_11380 [Chitinophagales bacterium]|nr:hypothetical protein [Chitinophagales bacterium]HNM30142.1 hypothetical protein [Chitinophagales bacterium]
MQIRKIAAALLLLATLPVAGLKAQSLNDVLKAHFDAVGQNKVAKLENMTTIGKLNQSGLDIPFKQIVARPGKLRVEGTFQGLTFIQVFNGTEGWAVNPFAGSTEPQPIPADQLDDLKIQADMDGMLWDYAKKGSTVTLEGTEDVEGTPCFKIRIVTADSSVFDEYIDTDSYMLIKSHSKTQMMGVDVETDTYFSNYMQKDGIAMPGRIENRYNGVTGEVITIESVEFDLEYQDALFDKPAAKQE